MYKKLPHTVKLILHNFLLYQISFIFNSHCIYGIVFSVQLANSIHEKSINNR